MAVSRNALDVAALLIKKGANIDAALQVHTNVCVPYTNGWHLFCIYYNINTISVAPFLSEVILAFISTRLIRRIGKIEAPGIYILYAIRYWLLRLKLSF